VPKGKKKLLVEAHRSNEGITGFIASHDSKNSKRYGSKEGPRLFEGNPS